MHYDHAAWQTLHGYTCCFTRKIMQYFAEIISAVLKMKMHACILALRFPLSYDIAHFAE